MSNYFITLEQPPYLFNYFLAKVLYIVTLEIGFPTVSMRRPETEVPSCAMLDPDSDNKRKITTHEKKNSVIQNIFR